MKIKIFIKYNFFFIVFATVFLNSCQQDDSTQEQLQQNKLNVKIEDKTLKELMNDQTFSTAFSKIPKQESNLPNNLASRTVMEQDYNFIISDDIPAKVITTESVISYTFHISRENDTVENSDSFENLIVLIDSLETAKAYIIKYNLLSEPIYVSQHDSYTIDAETELTPINFNDTQARISYTSSDGCTVMTLMCPYDHPHPAGGGCLAEDRGDLYWSADSSNCSGGGGGSSGSTGNPGSTPGNGNSNPGTSGGGNSNSGSGSGAGSPLVTTPVGVIPKITSESIKCATLKALTKTDSLSANIKPLVDQLRTKTNLDKEWYCTFKRSLAYSGEQYKTYDFPEGIKEGGGIDEAKLYLHPSFMGQIHTHPLSRYAMFSWTDLKALRDLYHNAGNHNKQDVFLMIVCHNGAVYSLKVDNFNALNVKINNDWATAKGTNDDRKRKYLDSEIEKEYTKDRNNLERVFLKEFKDFGISIYKASDDNLTNWNKLELNDPNSNNSTIKSTPCN
ncbi:hypothetical protein J2X31_000483 [Flavobacterium arsenatis]|uniref:Lipoprotein n=1 Tax=Flavobacterium arsenatis TaxID=1484332 RepID=A0ABU1TKI5_9FLAO|nr:hypothetical protein [Flavobacterium arsenatis]MDR6966490.1 hypothetical protein [Flavobacterium arsenatis]